MEISRAHYDALQDHLDQKYHDRGSEKYNGIFNNVLRDKLDILKQTFPTESSSPRRSDNNKDQVDDFEFESFFPSTLQFLDLSSLELMDEPDRFPTSLLLREEYNHISKLIYEYPQESHGLVILSGQPGTGEVLISLSCMI